MASVWKRIAMAGALLAWSCAAAAGYISLVRYEFTPGAAAETIPTWPADAGFEAASDQASLVIFLHPQCPCSRATVDELSRVVARNPARLRVTAFFFAPGAEGETWARTDLWTATGAIPGVEARVDLDATMARRFGARVSGHAMLYDASGALVFSGGITESRGHSGDNAGEAAIEQWLQSGKADRASTPVFGCALYGDSEVAAP